MHPNQKSSSFENTLQASGGIAVNKNFPAQLCGSSSVVTTSVKRSNEFESTKYAHHASITCFVRLSSISDG